MILSEAASPIVAPPNVWWYTVKSIALVGALGALAFVIGRRR